jgi:hypothetical protein
MLVSIDIIDDQVKSGALEDLVFYLENLRFLKKDGDSYEIKGKLLGKVPRYPIVHTQEEKDFLEEYGKLRELLSSYAEIYSRFTNYAEPFYSDNQIISKFDEIGLSSQSPSSPSYIKTVSKLLSIYYDIEQSKLEYKKGPVIVEREKLVQNIESTDDALNEYVDHFIVLIQRILELTISKRSLKVIPWRKIYYDNGIPIPTFLDSDSPTNVILVLESVAIAQNLPSELKRQFERTGAYTKFMILLNTNNHGEFSKAVSASLSDNVTSFLDMLNKHMPNQVVSPIPSMPNISDGTLLELEVPNNEKLLYRLIYGIIVSHLKLSKSSVSLKYEPIDEERITDSTTASNMITIEGPRIPDNEQLSPVTGPTSATQSPPASSLIAEDDRNHGRSQEEDKST